MGDGEKSTTKINEIKLLLHQDKCASQHESWQDKMLPRGRKKTHRGQISSKIGAVLHRVRQMMSLRLMEMGMLQSTLIQK